MKLYHLLRESLLATIMTIIITVGISFLPLKRDFIKGLPEGFLGFNVYDLYYTGEGHEHGKRDPNIVLVEIADNGADIADQVNTIQKYSPAVLGIDAVFEDTEDAFGNLKLVETLSRYHNIVGSCKFIDSTDPPGFAGNFFGDLDHRYPTGYINFIGNENSVIRYYPPFLDLGDTTYLSFTSTIMHKFADDKLKKLFARHKEKEIINYSGTIAAYTNFSRQELVESDTTGQLNSILRGKIILLGYFDKDPPHVMEDIHWSPMNEEVVGKSFPDMYGIVIQANILSMVISSKYANEASEFVSYIYAAVITFIFLLYMLFQYKKRPHPKHGKFLLFQFLAILAVLYIFFQVFVIFKIKTPLLPVMIALVLCVELLGVYRAIALWMHRKYGFKTVFTHQHII